jgi:diaminohydroxyphosphoribosylaminopyrimidine deaminase/5-amino-6-(5-phosphoribosylamino)uracil reductase
MPDDTAIMQRALDLAERGRATVSPNPMVGCVLVRDGQVVGEGYHEQAGGPHAEIAALRVAGEQAAGATAYVTLEPCNHTGRTGPCTQALIDAGVARVVVAAADPNPLAAGGADRLRAAGVDVEIGLLGAASRRQNEVFFTGVELGRPFVIAKAAVSLDGRIAAADGTSQWLTGEESRRRVHALRAEVDAVLVGSGTVLADDPQLTVRLPGYAGRQPLRVVLDRRGRVSGDARVLDDAAPTIVTSDDLPQVLKSLYEREVRSVLVEGGAGVLHACLDAGLVDRLQLYVAPVLLGERGRPLLAGPWAASLAEAPRWNLDSVEQVGGDAALTLSPAQPAPFSPQDED